MNCSIVPIPFYLHGVEHVSKSIMYLLSVLTDHEVVYYQCLQCVYVYTITCMTIEICLAAWSTVLEYISVIFIVNSTVQINESRTNFVSSKPPPTVVVIYVHLCMLQCI